MEQSDRSHVALGLTAEQKPIFDLLTKANLTKQEIKQIKKASVEVLEAIEERIQTIHGLFSKQSTRDGLRTIIYDLLYDETTGLPVEKFEPHEINVKTDILFNYFEHAHSQAA